MTSNIGSSYLLEDGDKFDGEITEATKELVMSEMKRRFKPEFLNRVDDIIMFKPLDKEGIRKIIDIFLDDLRRRLSDRQMTLSITENAKDILIKEGYDPIYGARPLKRYIGNVLETKIAKMVIAGQIYNGCHIVIDGSDDNIDIKVEDK